MAWLYGDGPFPKLPSFVHGFETPDGRLRRMRETNEALKKQEKRDQERRNRELFRQIERGDFSLPAPSPSSPPRPDDAPKLPEFPEVKPGEPFNYRLLRTGVPGGPSRQEWVQTDEEQDAPLGSQLRYNQLKNEELQ